MSLVRRVVPVIQARSKRRPWHLLRLAPAAMISSVVLGVAGYTLDSFLPIYGLGHGLRASLAVGLLTTLLIGEAAAQFPAGWLADHMDRRTLLFGATGVGAVACLGVTVVAQFASPILLFPMVAVIGLAFGTIWTAAAVLLGQSFSGGDLVAAYAVSGMLHGIGMVAGPLSIGAAVDRWGVEAIPLGIALCCLLYLPFSFSTGPSKDRGT
jgi:MFS family permease